MPNKNILLLGGAGYIGSVVTDHLLKLDYLVTNLDELIYDNFFAIKEYISNKNYFFLKENMDSYKINEDFLNNFDSIIILSGLVGDPISKKYDQLAKKYNESCLENFILKCQKSKIKKLIFISTCSNYGLIKKNEVADENHQLNPLSSYAKSKIKIEKYLKKINESSSFQITILRFATAFGISPRMRFDLTISHFFKDAYINKLLRVYDKDTWRPYCHVNDFSRLIERVVKDNNTYKFEIFNAGGDNNNYTKDQIAKKIKNILPKTRVDYHPYDYDPRNYKVNFNKVMRKFNFYPKYDLDYGINELFDLFKKNYFNFITDNINKFGNHNLDHKIIDN